MPARPTHTSSWVWNENLSPPAVKEWVLSSKLMYRISDLKVQFRPSRNSVPTPAVQPHRVLLNENAALVGVYPVEVDGGPGQSTCDVQQQVVDHQASPRAQRAVIIEAACYAVGHRGIGVVDNRSFKIAPRPIRLDAEQRAATALEVVAYRHAAGELVVGRRPARIVGEEAVQVVLVGRVLSVAGLGHRCRSPGRLERSRRP